VDDFLRGLATWLHVLGIALFLGPQVFLAFAWIPASRGIEDLPTRVRAMRTITRRFGYIGGAGLVLIIVGGSYLIGDWRDYYGVPGEVSFADLRYGVTFMVKMTLLLVMLAVLGLHTFVFGPRLLERMEDRAAGRPVSEDEIRSLRMQSMFASIAVLLLTLVILALGVALATTSWSLQEV
jgi:uncharacterized membrane protein